MLVVVILLVAGIRWRLRDMPLERDEGEYGYAGQLILQGIPPYQIAYNMKLPGTYAVYAVIMKVFGETAAGIRIGLLLANALTILLLYALGKRLFGLLAGVVTGVSYALLSVGPWVHGFAGHATHFVVLFATAGLLVLLMAIDVPRDWEFFCAGLLLGVAFLMKQPGAAFGLFGGLYILKIEGWNKKSLRGAFRHLLWYSLGAVLPFGVTCLVLWRAGVFAKFWFWTFSYAYQYGTNVGAAEGWHYFVKYFSRASVSAIGLWILAGVGLTAFVWNRKSRGRADFLLGLLFFSALAVSAGLYFRRHYFIMLLPVVCLLIGLALEAARPSDHASQTVWRYVPIVVYFVACSVSLFQESRFFFQMDPISASRYVYPYDPFPESVVIGNYIREHSSPSTPIVVFGSEPQILFYSQRRSATGCLYGYSLTEEQKYAATMQQQEISEIEAGRPEYIVYVQDWVILPGSDRTLFAWFQRYVTENFELVGVMRVRDGLQLRSEDEIKTAAGNLTGALVLFRRRIH